MDMEYLLEMCNEYDDDFLAKCMAQEDAAADISSAPLLPPRTCIISFDNSTTMAATPIIPDAPMSSKPPPVPRFSSPSSSTKNKIVRRSRGESRTVHHTVAERKRRLDLAQKFLELSATIPRSIKADKTSIVLGAINYVEQLKKRVINLEEKNKRVRNEGAIRHMTCSESNVKVIVLEKDIVLIYINCEKENGIELKILKMLENLHLFVTTTSVFPFGNSTLAITIIAKMSDAYRMTKMDLEDNVKQFLVQIVQHDIIL